MFFFLLIGCIGALDLSRATPLAPGELAIQAGGGVVLPVPTEGGDLSPYFGGAASVHGGVARGLELGGEVGMVSVGPGLGGPLEYAGIHAKIGLVNPDRGTVHVSLDPHLRAFGGASSGSGGASVDLPVLIGFDVGRSQLVLAPRLGMYLRNEVPWVMAGLAAAWSVPMGDRLELLPGVSASLLVDPASGNPISAQNVMPGASLGVRVRLD